MTSRLQEVLELLKDGKTLYLSVKITSSSPEKKKEDEALSTTIIYNGTITSKSRQKYLTLGVSFSPKKLLTDFEKMEREGKLKVRKAGNVYLLDGNEGKVYATIKIGD